MSIQASKKLNTSHFLGIDYGKAKVGLAIGNGETRMAFGYGVLKNDKKLWQKLAEIVKKEGIEKIIVGSPALSLRRAQRRGNLGQYNKTRDCFATLAMTRIIF